MSTSVTHTPTEVDELLEDGTPETPSEPMDDWTLLRDVIWPKPSTRFDK